MLLVQKFLKNRSIINLETDPFNLHVVQKENLVLLKYNQFKSDFTLEIVQESRGIILENKTWNVICHPFKKFFNLGETNAVNIIFEDSHILEKVDGSIIKIFHYNDEWKVATNGTIDANDANTRDGISFNELFFDVLPETNFRELTKSFDKDNTYLFELIHPLTRIVVDYGNVKELVFTGLINRVDGSDFNIFYKPIMKMYQKLFIKYPIRYPKKFNINNITDINELIDLADLENKNGNEFEGYVVCQVLKDKVICRVKIKSPKYVNLHHVATGENVTNNLINVIIKNEIEEFEIYLEKIPAHVADEYKSLKTKYFNLIKYLYEEGNKYRIQSKTMNRKELALTIQQHIPSKFTGMMFTMVDNIDITPNEMLCKLNIKKIKMILS